MARLTGGIFSNPSGSTGGITFGAARTRKGKVVTARQKTSPSNPDTPAQQAQRGKFRSALDIVKGIGPATYQDDWNRAVSQLPGFQSLQSIMLNNLSDTGTLSVPDDVPLGDLQAPQSISVTTGGASGDIQVSWDGAVGANGTDDDVIVAIAIPAAPTPRQTLAATVLTDIRQNEVMEFTDLPVASVCIVAVYARGEGTAEGKLSLVQWFSATSGA